MTIDTAIADMNNMPTNPMTLIHSGTKVAAAGTGGFSTNPVLPPQKSFDRGRHDS